MNYFIFLISECFFIQFYLINGLVTKCKPDDPKPVVIETKNGKIRGSCSFINIQNKNEDRSGNVYSWLSVPFAEPPLNNLRFRKPESVKSWNDTLDGTRIPNSCMQIINENITSKLEFTNLFSLKKNSASKLSEDCLYLNIWAPVDAYLKVNMKNPNYKAPILVVFHGGGDGTTGSSFLEIHNPSVFVALTGSIVITVNYRLGIFGNFYLKKQSEEVSFEEDKVLYEGNQGFLDQHMALKWISENAESFGGDSSKVTLLGYESGAVYVGYHLLYKPSWNYFRNAILQSGSPVNIAKNMLSQKAANNRTRTFMNKYIKCDLNSQSLIECLSVWNPLDLTMASRSFLTNELSRKSKLAAINLQSAFLPVVDGKIFEESPIKSFRESKFKKCNLIIGFNNNDGAANIPLNYGYVNDISKLNKTDLRQKIDYASLFQFLKLYYSFYPTWPLSTNNNEIFFNTVLNQYTKLTPKNYENSHLLSSNYFFTLRRIMTDEGYACPIFKFLEYVSEKSKTYLYVYNHRITTSKWPFWYGVTNGDEIASVFGQVFRDLQNSQTIGYNPWLPFQNFAYTETDRKVSKEMITRWANFIFNDDPNKLISRFASKHQNQIKNWPEFILTKSNKRSIKKRESGSSLYYVIRSNGTQILKLNMDSCQIWNSLIPSNLESFIELKKKEDSNVQKESGIGKDQEQVKDENDKKLEVEGDQNFGFL